MTAVGVWGGAHVLEDAAADVAVQLLHVRLGQAQQPPQPVQLRRVLIWRGAVAAASASQQMGMQVMCMMGHDTPARQPPSHQVMEPSSSPVTHASDPYLSQAGQWVPGACTPTYQDRGTYSRQAIAETESRWV